MRSIFPFIIFILLFPGTNLFSQRTAIDSLRTLLKEQKTDSGRVNILYEISREFMASRPDSALLAAQQALLIARKSKDVIGEIMILKQMADVYQVTGNYPQSLELYLQRLKLDEAMPDPERRVVTLISIANLYQLEGDYTRALLYAKKGDSLITKQQLTDYRWYSYLGFGDLYEKMDSLPQSLMYNEKAYQIATALKDSSLLGMSLINIGNVYVKEGRPDTALLIYFRGVSYLEQSGNESFLCESYQGIARALFSKGKTGDAVQYARKSLNIARQGNFNKMYLVSSALLTAIYKKANNIDSAFFYQEQTIIAKDSLFSQEKIRQIQNLSFNEQMRQQEIEFGKQQLKATYRIYALIASSAVFLLITFILWWNNRYKQKAFSLLQKQKQETDKQKQKAELTLDELRAAQNQLILAEKMASLGELTAGIAHEIQNPLNFVNNFSEVTTELIGEAKEELVRNNTKDVEGILNDVKLNLEKITSHGKRADAIVKGMLAHSRKSTGQKELVDINALAEECFRLSYHGLRAKDKSFNATMKTEFDQSLSKISLVPQDIGRVMLNLLNNAFYAVKEKAATAPPEGYQPTVTITTSIKANRVNISIADNGNGIPQQLLDKIFQPFFTTKPSGQGTGLGLSLSYDIIKGHGGEIKVDTKLSEGTTFLIQLPYA